MRISPERRKNISSATSPEAKAVDRAGRSIKRASSLTGRQMGERAEMIVVPKPFGIGDAFRADPLRGFFHMIEIIR
jgi:hypothetical protein